MEYKKREREILSINHTLKWTRDFFYSWSKWLTNGLEKICHTIHFLPQVFFLSCLPFKMLLSAWQTISQQPRIHLPLEFWQQLWHYIVSKWLHKHRHIDHHPVYVSSQYLFGPSPIHQFLEEEKTFLYCAKNLNRKYVGVQSWKAAHLPTLEIRVEQKRNRVKKREKWGRKKKINAAATGNRTRDPSITDQMSVLTNQVHLKIQFRHRFDQKSQITDSLHRLGSFFARTSSVPLEMIDTINFDFAFFNLWSCHYHARKLSHWEFQKWPSTALISLEHHHQQRQLALALDKNSWEWFIMVLVVVLLLYYTSMAAVVIGPHHRGP